MSIRSADALGSPQALAAQQPLALSATAFLREHHRELITIRDLADPLSYSPSHLTRSFTAAVGVSPIRYLSSWRLHEAKHLLISEGLDVAEACYEVGYTSVGTFSRRFVRDVGLPPAALRRWTSRSWKAGARSVRGRSQGPGWCRTWRQACRRSQWRPQW